MIGIYKITNKINGKCYIGQSINIEKRFRDHKAPRSLKRNSILSRAIKKYGIQNFEFSIICECKREELNEREMFFIKEFAAAYNMNDGGCGNRGHLVSAETREILSKKCREAWNNFPEEIKQKIIKENLKGPAIGHIVSMGTRQKLRVINLGKKASDLTRKRMSNKHKTIMRGNNHGNKAVMQINKKSSEVIEIFDSIKKAADHFRIHPSSITGVLKGRRKSAAGYKWELVNKSLIKEK
jgi:group I intron endonuclease